MLLRRLRSGAQGHQELSGNRDLFFFSLLGFELSIMLVRQVLSGLSPSPGLFALVIL
jgi:hypothetical protein